MASTAGLAEPFKTNVEHLIAASHGAVWITSGFRTYNQQVQARKANGCPDIYKSPASACRIPTAIPGDSLHEKGLAADLGGDLAIAERLAPQFGMHNPVPRDPRHFEPLNPSAFAGVAAQVGGPVDKVADVGSNPGIADEIVAGVRKIVLLGLTIAGALTLLALGAYRTTTGQKAARAGKKAAGSAAQAGAAVATDGESLAAESPRSAP